MRNHSVATFHATQGIEDKNHGRSLVLGGRCGFGEEIDPDLRTSRFQNERNCLVAVGTLASRQKGGKFPLGNAGVARVDACRKRRSSMLLQDFWKPQGFYGAARNEFFRGAAADTIHVMPSHLVRRQTNGGKRRVWNQQNIGGKKAHASSSSSSSFR